MKLMNKIAVGLVAALLVALASFAAYEAKFVNLANDFVAAIEQKDVERVRSLLPDNGNDTATYAALLQQMVPNGVVLRFEADSIFLQRGLFSEIKTISGTISPDGAIKPIPVTVVYVAEQGNWKIKEIVEHVEKGKPTAAEDQQKAKIVALVRQSMANFILSKKAKSMELFYSTISDAWKKETTIEKLNTDFAPVLNDPVDWSFLNPVEPTITNYIVNKDGILTVIGVYPSKPRRLIFEQNFITENGERKLVGFKLFTADPGANQADKEPQKVEETKSPTVAPSTEIKSGSSTKKSTTKNKSNTTTKQ